MRRALVLSLGIAIALSLLTLRLGFVLDDYMHLANTEGVVLPARPLGYFTFLSSPAEVHAYVDRGPLPWWTLPELRLAFFRPLSSALIYFDHTVFPHQPWIHHVHSALWFLLLVFAASTFYRRTLPEAAAALALVLFTLDDAHLMPVAWLANRNALVSAVPAIFALAAHVRWREEGWKPGRWLPPLAIAVALTGGEGALAFLGYFVAYELFARKGNVVRALAPLFGVLLSWAVIYKAFGFGAFGSATYVDPGVDPLEFLRVAPGRFFAQLGALTLKVTSDLWLLAPRFRPLLVGAGLVGTTLVALTVRSFWAELPEHERRAIGWLSCGALVALIPGLATFPLDRLLLAASLGSLGVFALLLRAAWRRVKKPLLVIGWLGGQNVLLAPAIWVLASTSLTGYARSSEAAVYSDPPERFTGRVVLLTASDPAPAIYGLLFLHAAGRRLPERWWTLSMNAHAHRVRRVGERALELEVVDGRMIDTVFEQLMRGEDFGMHPGHVVQLDGLRITVLDSNEGHPTRIRADFALPLADHKLLIWRDGTFVQIAAPQGSAVLELPAEPTLFERAFTGQ